jgi:uncharacterized Zn finger protein (UPF0148 family)
MKRELDLACPKCGNIMELINADEDGGLMRVCPVCATLAWNEKDGKVEIREPQEVTGEEKRRLLENSKFITADEELERLRRSKKTEPLQ